MTAPTGMSSGTKIFGKQIHNLVIEYDSEKGAEFRVQCEVPLSVEEAQEVMSAIESRNLPSLESAKKLVYDRIVDGASKRFRDTVSSAFDDNIELIRSHGSKKP